MNKHSTIHSFKAWMQISVMSSWAEETVLFLIISHETPLDYIKSLLLLRFDEKLLRIKDYQWFNELGFKLFDDFRSCFSSCASPVVAEDVRLPAPGQQTDVHHAISSDPVQCCQWHAAVLRSGGHRTDGPSNHQVSTLFLMLSPA